MDAQPAQGGEVTGRESGRAFDLDVGFEPLAAVTRGPAVESIHRGAIVVVDGRGELVDGIGDCMAPVHLRSVAKPFQALAVVESGAVDTFSMGDREIAVMCASHAGGSEHVRVVAEILARLDVSPSALVCGPLEHTCSGKHAGMVALARQLGAPVEGYQLADHPVQVEVARTVRSLLDRLPGPQRGERSISGPVFAGLDGCGVPVIRTSLLDAARLYALLAGGSIPALARVRDAMLGHPELVGGEARLDTHVMRAAAGRVVAKGGAEGVQGLGLPAWSSPDGGPETDIGCMVKVEDGSSRPLPALAVRFLRAYGQEEAAEALEASCRFSIESADGREAGRLFVAVRPEAIRRYASGSRQAPMPLIPLGAEAWAGDKGLPGGIEAAEVPSSRANRRGFGERPARVEEAELPGVSHAKLSVGRGDERKVLRFLRKEWPPADEETFGHPVEWIAEPMALVLERRRRIIAVLRGHFLGGVASVDELMVSRGYRGQGVGSLLLDRFEKAAGERHCSRVILRAVKASTAEEFYRKRGYRRECVQYSYEFGRDYVRLVRRLRDGRGSSDMGEVTET